MERAFKGIWIPKEIWLDVNLNISKKLLLVEIDSLDNEKGCFASNDYFAKFFGISKDRVSKLINELVKDGYITSKIIYDGKQVKERILKVNYSYCRKQLEGIEENNDTPIGKENDSPIGKNNEDNNTSFNNTIINNTINNKKKPPSKSTYGEYSNVKLTQEEFDRLVNEEGMDIVLKAIKILDEYIETKHPKYYNHNLVLRKWPLEQAKGKQQQYGKPKEETDPIKQFAAMHGITM